MADATNHRYIVNDQHILSGEPIIDRTRTSIRAIAELWRQGVQPEQITQYLPHLSLAQVFDAQSYYSDHRSEINTHIERNQITEDKVDPLVRDQRVVSPSNCTWMKMSACW